MCLMPDGQYAKLSDKEIVERIITEPYDEDAAVYLIYDRYLPLCTAVCKRIFNNTECLDELQSELFMLLKGRRCDWHPLRSFQWRSSFGCWLKIVVFNLSLGLRGQLIENEGRNISLNGSVENEGGNSSDMDIPVDEEAEREHRYRMVLLQEAINSLENPDQRFVLVRRLMGYSSKEVAVQLQEYWHRQNIVRCNNKGQIVVPDSGYIDNLFKRGYDKVRIIYKNLDR